MSAFLRENSGPVLFSVLLHGALAAALVYMTVVSPRPPTLVQSVPINAVVVDSQILHAAQRAQMERAAQQAEQARAAAEAAAKATADAKAAEEANAAAAKAAEQARAADAAKAAEEAKTAQSIKQAKATQAAEAAQAEAARAAEAANRQAQMRKAADEKQAADAKAAAAARAQAEAKAEAEAKRAADERARKDREDELHRQLAEEEHVQAIEASPLRDRYVASLRNRIQNAWIKPPSARVGVDCIVEVTQVPGGEVTNARVTQCNGDAAVRQSIENAVYRASPLPDPPDPALFQRNFAFRFKPDE
jgi:colicin import membrane protein